MILFFFFPTLWAYVQIAGMAIGLVFALGVVLGWYLAERAVRQAIA